MINNGVPPSHPLAWPLFRCFLWAWLLCNNHMMHGPDTTVSCWSRWYAHKHNIVMSIWEELLKLLKFASPSAELLYLTGERALLIWYKMCGKDVFHSIEWGSLSAELVDKHHSLFTRDEMTELSAGKRGSREAINSAIRRTAQSVLHAFYKSLCDTQTCGGAAQHASIAEEIRKESECVCSCIRALCLWTCQWLSAYSGLFVPDT